MVGKKAVLIYTNSNSPPSTTVWWVLASYNDCASNTFRSLSAFVPYLFRNLESAFFLPRFLASASWLHRRPAFIRAYFLFVFKARETIAGQSTSCSSWGKWFLKSANRSLSLLLKSIRICESVHIYVSDSKDFKVILVLSPALFKDTLRTWILL